MNAHRLKKIVGFSLVPAVLAGLAGCAAALSPSTDTTSPVAPRVQALVDANRTYPRWAAFPPTPQGLPTPPEVAAQVDTLQVTSGALAGEVGRIEWQLDDPVAFARAVNSRIDVGAVAPVTAEDRAEVEAFAQRTRQRGTAPPPIDRVLPAPR